MDKVKLVGNLLYAFLMALVKPAVAVILGAILMKVYSEGTPHLIGVVIFWGAVI